MDQSITLKIAGKEYAMKASSPEAERLMRLAAEAINEKLAVYGSRFPDKTLEDRLAFVALNETVSRINFQRRLSLIGEEVKAFQEQTDRYLDTADKK